MEGEKYRAESVWAPTWARLERKILALKEKVDIEVRRQESRGDQPRDMRRKSRAIEPLASFTERGDLEWNENLVKRLKTLGKPATGQANAGRS